MNTSPNTKQGLHLRPSKRSNLTRWTASALAVAVPAALLGGMVVSPVHGAASPGSVNRDFNASIDNLSKGWPIGEDIAVQKDGKVIVVGSFGSVNLKDSRKIVRLNTNGSIDKKFKLGSGFNGQASKVVVQPNGKIIVSGEFSNYNGYSRNDIVRLNSNGSLDTSFNAGSGFNGSANDFAVQNDGKIVVVGSFTKANTSTRNRIVRFNTNGTVDSSFNPSLTETGSWPTPKGYGVAVQPNGRIVVTGKFNRVNGTSRNGIARLNTNGTLDTSFNVGAGLQRSNSTIAGVGSAILLQTDNKVVVTGDFNKARGSDRLNIARFNTNGTLDTTFRPTLSEGANDLALAPDRKIVAVGEFSKANGTNRNGIARFNTNGTLDTAFKPGTGLNYHSSGLRIDVRGVAVRSNSNVLVTGSFSTPRSSIAELYGKLTEYKPSQKPAKLKVKGKRTGKKFTATWRWPSNTAPVRPVLRYQLTVQMKGKKKIRLKKNLSSKTRTYKLTRKRLMRIARVSNARKLNGRTFVVKVNAKNNKGSGPKASVSLRPKVR